MVDAFLTIAAVVILIILLVVNTYLLALYLHPEDRGFGASVAPKIIVVIGLTLSLVQVFMVSLDISNTRGWGGGLNMDTFWVITSYLTAFILLIVIPSARYYAETDEQKAFKSRLWSTAIYTGILFACFAVFIIVGNNVFGYANIPIFSQTYKAGDLVSSGGSLINIDTLFNNNTSVKKLFHINLSLSLFVMAVFSTIGWILLIFFGGMGFFSIPLDLISEWRNRPQNKSQKEIMARKIELQGKLADLLPRGLQIEESQKEVENTRGFIAKRSAQANVNKDINRFKADVLELETDFEKFSGEVNYKDINLGAYTMKLWIGIIILIASFIWWFHILFNVIKKSNGYPVSLFLNTAFIWIDETLGVGFVSTALFTALSVFLVIAVVLGNVKFGIKIPLFFTIHPMKQNETLMNSMLHNVWLTLSTSVGIVQFLSNTFTQYSRLTSSEFLFGTLVKYMTFFRVLFTNNLFEMAFLVWSVLTLLSLICMCMCGGRRQPTYQKQAKEKNNSSMTL